MASLVAVGWLFAAWLPLVVVGFLSPLPFNFLAFLFFLYAYLGYSGFRALRKGWKSRFILRVVVPAGLLLASSAGTALWYLGAEH